MRLSSRNSLNVRRLVNRVGTCFVLTVLLCVTASCGLLSSPPQTEASRLNQEPTGWFRINPVPIDLDVGHALLKPQRQSDQSQPVIVNLWASYCGPCLHELPILEYVYGRQDVSVVGISQDIQAKFALRAMRSARVSYPNRLNSNASLLHSLHGIIPMALPSSLLVLHGHIMAVHVGPFLSKDDALAPLRKGNISALPKV